MTFNCSDAQNVCQTWHRLPLSCCWANHMHEAQGLRFIAFCCNSAQFYPLYSGLLHWQSASASACDSASASTATPKDIRVDNGPIHEFIKAERRIYMRQQTRPSLLQIMACRLYGAKPLSKPMLDPCELYTWEQISVNRNSKHQEHVMLPNQNEGERGGWGWGVGVGVGGWGGGGAVGGGGLLQYRGFALLIWQPRVPLRLKSPALPLFTEPLIQTQIKENIKAPRQWPLWGEFTAQMASNVENVSIWWHHHVSPKSHIISFAHNLYLSFQLSHRLTAVLCAKFQTDLTTEMDLMDKQVLARFVC